MLNKIHIIQEHYPWVTKLKAWSLIRKNIFETFNQKRMRG
jgi:hypothetical protein